MRSRNIADANVLWYLNYSINYSLFPVIDPDYSMLITLRSRQRQRLEIYLSHSGWQMRLYCVRARTECQYSMLDIQ